MSSSSPRPPPKPILLFALHAAVLTVLLGLWPTPRLHYAPLLREQASWLYGGGEPPRVVVRENASRKTPDLDTALEAVTPAQEAPLWRVSFSAVRMGYWPSAALLALLLATPLTPRHRALAVVVGLVWLDAFALGRIGIEVQRAFLELEANEGGAAGGALLAARTSSEVLNSNIVVIASVLIGWVVVASPRRTIDPRGLFRILGMSARTPAASGTRGSS